MIPRPLSHRRPPLREGSVRVSKWGLALLLSCACTASAASAIPSVDLYFTQLNGAAIGDTQNLAVLPGDRIGVEMRMTGDERGISAYTVSVDFDSADTGRILLDDFATVLAPGFGRVLGPGPQGPDDPLGDPGMVTLFAAFTELVPGGLQPNPFTVNATVTVGTLEFTVTDEILNGPAAIAPGLFNEGVDEILSNDIELIGGDFQFVPISADFAFGVATLSAAIAPEPGTALLFGGGLLVLARIRRRR